MSPALQAGITEYTGYVPWLHTEVTIHQGPRKGATASVKDIIWSTESPNHLFLLLSSSLKGQGFHPLFLIDYDHVAVNGLPLHVAFPLPGGKKPDIPLNPDYLAWELRHRRVRQYLRTRHLLNDDPEEEDTSEVPPAATPHWQPDDEAPVLTEFEYNELVEASMGRPIEPTFWKGHVPAHLVKELQQAIEWQKNDPIRLQTIVAKTHWLFPERLRQITFLSDLGKKKTNKPCVRSYVLDGALVIERKGMNGWKTLTSEAAAEVAAYVPTTKFSRLMVTKGEFMGRYVRRVRRVRRVDKALTVRLVWNRSMIGEADTWDSQITDEHTIPLSSLCAVYESPEDITLNQAFFNALNLNA